MKLYLSLCAKGSCRLGPSSRVSGSVACKRMRSLVRALAWACVPRVWLPPGAGRPVGPGVRGACLWDWQLLGGLGFWSCGNSLLLAENYNRTTTNNTTEAQSAQRLNGGGRNNLRLDDPCGLWASLARQPLDPWQLPWPVSKAHASGSAVRGPGRPGCISDARQAGLPGVNRSVDEGR
jgi:hypothetical protein